MKMLWLWFCKHLESVFIDLFCLFDFDVPFSLNLFYLVILVLWLVWPTKSSLQKTMLVNAKNINKCKRTLYKEQNSVNVCIATNVHVVNLPNWTVTSSPSWENLNHILTILELSLPVNCRFYFLLPSDLPTWPPSPRSVSRWRSSISAIAYLREAWFFIFCSLSNNPRQQLANTSWREDYTFDAKRK